MQIWHNLDIASTKMVCVCVCAINCCDLYENLVHKKYNIYLITFIASNQPDNSGWIKRKRPPQEIDYIGSVKVIKASEVIENNGIVSKIMKKRRIGSEEKVPSAPEEDDAIIRYIALLLANSIFSLRTVLSMSFLLHSLPNLL